MTSHRLPLFLVSLALAAAYHPAASAQGPLLPAGKTGQVADKVWVIPDQRVNLVPNVGIIVGDNGIMVVDTGMGPRNATTVLDEVGKLSDKPILYLAITHFHPEHGMGAQSFPATTRIIVPRAQKQELRDKGKAIIEMFKGFGPEVGALLEDVILVDPDIAFDKEMEVDLGGITVRLLHFETAHTRGDMFVYLPQQRLLFGGDVVINRFFPIMPDLDSSPRGWIATLEALQALKPEIVVPGHGAVGDAALIDEMKTYLEGLEEPRCRAQSPG